MFFSYRRGLSPTSSEMASPPNVSEMRVLPRLQWIPGSCLLELPHQQEGPQPLPSPMGSGTVRFQLDFLLWIEYRPKIQITIYICSLSIFLKVRNTCSCCLKQRRERDCGFRYPGGGFTSSSQSGKEVNVQYSMHLWFSLSSLQLGKCWMGDLEWESRVVYSSMPLSRESIYLVSYLYPTSNLIKAVGL